MKLFLFENLEHVSDNYHDAGGAVVIAPDKKQAEKLIYHTDNLQVTPEEWDHVAEFELSGNTYIPEVIVFPDAGCC